MANDQHALRQLAQRLTQGQDMDALAQRLAPQPPAPWRGPNLGGGDHSPQAVARRWAAIDNPAVQASLRGELEPQHWAANIEHGIGRISLPLAVAGPLQMCGLHVHGPVWLPLATHEAALVASVHRGCLCINESGGASALLLAEGVTRSPGFIFTSNAQAGRFVLWVLEQQETFATVTAETSRHARLTALRVSVEGNHVYVLLDFHTGDAAGQNMVTIATQAILSHIAAHSPVVAEQVYVEANASGDKKASAQSFGSVRGRKVTAEVRVPAAVCQQRLHADPEALCAYWRMSAIGGVLSGTIGIQGHYANALTALFIATGQDAACVAEAAVGVTRFEVQNGDLYATVTLPNLIVGTVGGGTTLPHQAACLQLMGCQGDGRANALAEVCAAAVLAGELSIIGALASGEFARAHERLARLRRRRLSSNPESVDHGH